MRPTWQRIPFKASLTLAVVGVSLAAWRVHDERQVTDPRRISRYSDGVDESLRARGRLSDDLARALADDQMELVYQPIVRGGDGSVVEVEALLRWHHPRLGQISPSVFIPLAEETGIIRSIGEWVLRTAVRQVRLWHLAGEEWSRGLGLSVNLSPVQLRSGDIVTVVRRVLHDTGFDPRLLTLEVTEGTLLADLQNSASQLEELRRLGVRIALDDFGTGYSSLAYLSTLPVTTVKIDRSFIKHLTGLDRYTVIVRAIVAIASSLCLEVTAEGVETELQQTILNQVGCEYAQGYLHAEPMSPEDFIGYARKTRRRLAIGERMPGAVSPSEGREAEGLPQMPQTAHYPSSVLRLGVAG